MLKRRFAAAYITELRPYATSEVKGNRNLVAAVLDRLYTAKMRASWGVLGRNREWGGAKLKIVRVLGEMEGRKIRSGLQGGLEAVRARGRWRESRVGQLCRIVQLVNRQKLYGGFAQLCRFTRRAATAPIASEPVKNAKTSKLESLAAAVAPDNPLLIQKIEALKEAKQAIEAEITEMANKAQSKKGEGSNNSEERSHKIGLLSQQNEQMRAEM